MLNTRNKYTRNQKGTYNLMTYPLPFKEMAYTKEYQLWVLVKASNNHRVIEGEFTLFLGVNILAKIPYFFSQLLLISSSFFSAKQWKILISSQFSEFCLFLPHHGPKYLPLFFISNVFFDPESNVA